MKHDKAQEFMHSRIWNEEPEADNPAVAARCYCSGYDVYGELLGKASWFECLYPLVKLERPRPELSRLLERRALVPENPR